MKATLEIPDELYRLVKTKSALEGRAVRDVTVDLYQRYVDQAEAPAAKGNAKGAEDQIAERILPPWFGILGKAARTAASHEMSAIRESLARGIARDRDL